MRSRAITGLQCRRLIMVVSALSCVGVLVGPLWGQTDPPGSQGEAMYVAQVSGTDVYVRAGGSTAAYPCAKISHPETVTVVGEVNQWLKILPPPGVFSVIAKDYVSPDETGESGVVTGDNVRVRAGGVLRNSGFWIPQMQLNKGYKVQILGTVEKYYKIVPPEGAYFWISKLYVNRPGEMTDRPKVVPIAPETVKPTPEPTPPTPAKTTEPIQEADKKLQEAMKEFRSIEAELATEYKRPPARRDLKRFIEKYRAIEVGGDSVLQPYIDYRVWTLEAALKRREEGKKFRELVGKVDEKQKEWDMKRTELEVKSLEQRKITYAAEGILTTSALYTGTPLHPRRFVVLDGETGTIVAYVENPAENLDLVGKVGKKVGVLGEGRYEGETQSKIIDAERVVVLAEDVEIPAPPKATVGPFPAAPPPQVIPELTHEPLLKPLPAPPPDKPKRWPPPEPPRVVPPTRPPRVLEFPLRPEFPLEPQEPPAAEPAPPTTSPQDVESEPSTQPATGPGAASEPIPPTGLPIVKPIAPATQPIDEEEYD